MKVIWKETRKNDYMTVKELIKVLKTIDGNATVLVDDEGCSINPLEIYYDEKNNEIYL